VRVRTDLSATLFLSDPESYDGGELTIEHSFGTERVKLPAGHMLLYPASSLHRVEPVTRGERLAAFFWVQSMVQSTAERTLLFDLDQTIQRLTARLASDGQPLPELIALTGIYHNLVRRSADC
jgi:PKHD-type hydroxylase